MTPVEYLVKNTVASHDLAERVWGTEQAVLGAGTFPRGDRDIVEPVTLYNRVIEETNTGRPLSEPETRALIGRIAPPFPDATSQHHPAIYVLESFIRARTDMSRYAREPTFIVLENAELISDWKQIDSDKDSIEGAWISTHGKGTFYTASIDGPIYHARTFPPLNRNEFAVRKHNLFMADQTALDYINTHHR